VGWVRRGQIFEVDGREKWMASHHAQLPVPVLVGDDRLRVYYSTRDEHNRSRSGFFETEAGEPANVAYVHDRPALDLGEPGAFDELGAMASCVVEAAGELHLYYVGWTTGAGVPYRTEIGLAVSADGGVTFTRAQSAPVIGQTPAAPYGANCPFVLHEAGLWRMWYGAVTGWDRTGELPESMYEIRYAESSDGVRWRLENTNCIEPLSDSEANTRAWVMRDAGTYHMWFSYRSILDFRENRDRSYRIGYAESDDGVNWERRDEEAGLGPSNDGWDSEMAAYGCVYEHGGARHMLYNGNGFGRSGIGHAVAA
jgi:predicted GH43/DUF377 family glycosyl hydrolase